MKRSIVQPISLPCKLLLYVLCGVLVTATVGCRRSTPFPPDTVPRFAQTVAEFTFKVGQPVALILPAASGGEEPLAYRNALHRATMLNERLPIVAALIATNMDVNARDSNDRTALDFAQNPAVVAALRAAGAVCGGASVFTGGGCHPGPTSAATADAATLMYRDLARIYGRFPEQSGASDSAREDSL